MECKEGEVVSFEVPVAGVKRAKGGGRRVEHGCAGRRVGEGSGPTREYVAWVNMQKRSRDRGDEVYEGWRGAGRFGVFLEDMGRVGDGQRLVRVDRGKGWGPGNCEWRGGAAVFSGVGGEKLAERCRLEGVRYGLVYGRLRAGWGVEEAFGEPVGRQGKRVVSGVVSGVVGAEAEKDIKSD